MLLLAFAGRAFARPAAPGLARAAAAHEVWIWCSRFCPHVPARGWRVAARLAAGMDRRLRPPPGAARARLPAMRQRAQGRPRRRWPHDHQGRCSDPSRCWHRHQQALCRAHLAAADAVSVAGDTPLLAAQRRIDALLDGQLEPTLAGEQLEPPSTCATCSRSATFSTGTRGCRDRSPADPYLRPGRRLHGSIRPSSQRCCPKRSRSPIFPTGQRSRTRCASSPTAATSPTARRSPPASRRSVRDAARRAAGALTQTTWAPASSRMGFDRGAHRRPDDLDDRLQARHVPQLFWAEDYQRELAELFDFDYFTHWLGRRFCSIAAPADAHAARLARRRPLPRLPRALRQRPLPHHVRQAGRDRPPLRARPPRETIANQHAQDGLIDYQQRRPARGLGRHRHRDLVSAPTPPGPQSSRPRAARAPRARLGLAVVPAHQRPRARRPHRAADREPARQRYFIRDVLPPLRERLLILAELLLATPADARSDAAQPPRRSTSPAWTPGTKNSPWTSTR